MHDRLPNYPNRPISDLWDLLKGNSMQYPVTIASILPRFWLLSERRSG